MSYWAYSNMQLDIFLNFLLLDNPQKAPQYVSDTTTAVGIYYIILKSILFLSFCPSGLWLRTYNYIICLAQLFLSQ